MGEFKELVFHYNSGLGEFIVFMSLIGIVKIADTYKKYKEHRKGEKVVKSSFGYMLKSDRYDK